VIGPREGSRWAHYEIRHEIARGNMGVVFRALDTKTGRDVALKLLVAGHADPDAAERFRREAKSLARLDHPNVVGVHSYGVQESLPFMAMDFVAGTTLHELLERGALTTSRAVALLADVARGLDHAHAHGVLHRDVKPANILIGSDGRARLTDFGLAKLSDASLSLTHEGDIIGTPVFMSPEQITGDVRATGPGLDVWALGVILYVVLTRGLPFRGRTVEEVSDAVVRLEPPPPSEVEPSVPPDLERICLCALKKDHRQRYRSANELARDLDAFLRGGQVLAGTVTPGVRARRAARFLRLHGAAVGALSAGLLLIGVAIGAKAFLDDREAGVVQGKQDQAADDVAAEIEGGLAAAEQSLQAYELAKARDAAEKAAKALERAQTLGASGERGKRLSDLIRAHELLSAKLSVAGSNEVDEPALARLVTGYHSGDLEAGRWALDHALRLGSAAAWADDLPEPSAIPEEDEARAAQLLALRVTYDRVKGRARTWAPLLTRSSKTALGRAARLHEARWLTTRQRLEEARQVLWAADQSGQRAPLLHARLLRAVQRDDPQTFSLEGSSGWEALHARLVEQARSGPAVLVDLATAELALLRGELRRARAVLAPWLGERLCAGVRSEAQALDVTALALQDDLRGREEARKLIRAPGVHPRARARLAWLEPDALGEANRSEESHLAGLADRVDRALAHLVLSSLGRALGSPALSSQGALIKVDDLPTALLSLGPGDVRAQHLGLRARVALIHLSKGRVKRARELLNEGLGNEALTHPELSLARRLLEEAPLELPVAPWWTPPPGIVPGRRWAARYSAFQETPLEADRAYSRANAALHLAIRHAPTDPYVRLARARLRLLRAARMASEEERRIAREGALRDASLAVAIAPDSTSAWEALLFAAWAVDEATLPQILARAQGDWREALHPAERLAISLLGGEAPPKVTPWFGALAEARRHDLRRAAGDPKPGAAFVQASARDLREALARAGQGESRAPLEGELLLRDPIWLGEHLSGACPAPAGCALEDSGATAWARAQDVQSGPLAAPARALLLVDTIRRAGQAGRGRAWLEALWRDRGGPGCLRLEVAWILWTRPAGQRVLLADLEPLPGKNDPLKNDPLAHLLAALIAKAGKPRDALAAKLWDAPPVKRWR
jgi:protein kinase-like protein